MAGVRPVSRSATSRAVPAADLPYHAKSIVYGVESVPVRLHP